jgi:NAD-dependent dihydropyrimidine dehydrogenase PreA subunit
MKSWSYVKNGESLSIDAGRCTGCGTCLEVCPHGVFVLAAGKAVVADRGACMECGACGKNCPLGAIEVSSGVGCAAAIINGRIRGTAPDCGCGGGCCGG